MFEFEYESRTGEQLVVEYRVFARPGYNLTIPEEAVKIHERLDGEKHLRGELWLGDTLGHRQTHHADQLDIINHLDQLCEQRLDPEDLGAEMEVYLFQRDFIPNYN